MEDLDDDMLTQILVRLPNCAAVKACSPVNKRWCSLISDPSFRNMFTNHRKKATTLLMGSGSDIDEPPWTIVKTMMTKRGPNRYNANDKSRLITEFIIGSPKLSLEYMPSIFLASATFKDLVLCFDYPRAHQGRGRLYYITNPLTKQWVALSPCPRKDQWMIISTALICQQPCNHTQDYKYRVVEARLLEDHSLEKIELVVYCSEIGEWKEIHLRVPKEARLLEVSTKNHEPEIVVCNGIIYFKSGLCLVALDPFDVNDACDMTLDVRVMPQLPDFGYLLESSGHLLVVRTPEEHEEGTALELKMVLWKLDLNQAPLVWVTTFKGLCKGARNETESPCNAR